MDYRIRVHLQKIFCALIFLAFGPSAPAQEMFWTTEAKSAYQLISELKIEEGLKIIRLQSITHQHNQIWLFLEDYAEFLKIFVQEDLRAISTYKSSSAKRLVQLSVVPETNPLSLMAQSQISIHHCALHLQQSQFVAAATDISKAFKMLRKNQKLHPGDVGNLRLYASLKVAFGAIPDQYRWLVSIVTSLSGTIEEGLVELHSILKTTTPQTNIFYPETVLFTALAEGKFNNKPQRGLQIVYKHFGKSPDNKAVQYVMATLQIADGNNDGAIRTLTHKPSVQTPLRIPFLDFMLGECKLFRGDKDADTYFKNFLVYHKGKHYIKEAHQKLAWYALLREDRQGYFNHMQQILIKGASTTDEDQQALHEAETHTTPHPVLLRARLYYDGGYYEQALDLLTETFYATLHQHSHRLEFLYRKGRVLQAKKDFAEALHYLTLTITTGQFEKYYYACSAALQLGIIMENMGSKEAAIKYYYMCLDITPATYGTSLHQKARMGLNRVER